MILEPRTIDELLTLYELEPSLKDVFVEGPADRALVEVVLNHCGLSQVQVNEIEFVAISQSVLARVNTCGGNRKQVIALALELEREMTVDLRRRVCCIADADEEAGGMPAIQGALLLYTDFTSAELYAFSPAVLQRYFDQVVLGFPMSGEVAIQLILPVLRELALSRRLNSALGLGTAPVDPTGDCEIAGAKIVFDLERFTLRFLNKAASTHRIEEYRAGHARLGAVLNADHRLWVHGEDMLDILHWVVVRLRGGARTVARPLLGKTLLLATPLGELAAQPLFLELCGRLS